MTHRWYGQTMRHYRPEYPSECPDDQDKCECSSCKQEEAMRQEFTDNLNRVRSYYENISEAVRAYSRRGYRVCVDPSDDDNDGIVSINWG